MEKLLSKQLKNKNNYATNLNSLRTKNSFFSYGGYETVFAQRTANNFFNQPYSGCFILVNQYQDLLTNTVNFFQDGSVRYAALAMGWTVY